MDRPNILILYADQHRWDALGANGNAEVITPHLDGLASSPHGISFQRCFVQHPLCMPSRVSFLTGQYPSTMGITHMGVPVPESTETLASYLKPYGYRSANLGKLHFLPHANRDHRAPHPTYGFDQLEISDEPGVYEDAYLAWVRQVAPEQLSHIKVGLPPARATWINEMGPQAETHHAELRPRDDFKEILPFEGDPGYTHSAYVAERTLHFLNRQRPADHFLCVAGFYAPHAPLIVPHSFLDLYDRAALSLPNYSAEADAKRREMGWTDDYLREMRHGYYAMISEVDHHIGRIIKRLKETGQFEKTIIVYTADHGEWLGDHLKFGKGYPGDDAVTRVPLVVHFPAGLATDIDSQVLIESLDLLPTLLESAGIQIPPNVQGRSFYPLLSGRGSYQARASALTEHAGWKSLRSDRYRYLIESNGNESLWDTAAPQGEAVDLSGDKKMNQVLADHRRLLLQRILENEAPLPRTWPY